MTERQQKTDAELREDVNRLRQRVRKLSASAAHRETAGVLHAMLDLLTDAGLGQS